MSRIIAQVVVAGATVLFRAATQAWHQALQNAHKTGVASEAAQKATQAASKITSSMSLQEAQLILGVEQAAPWGDVVKRFKHLFDVNEKHGSFYLQSKVYRAKERLEQEYEAEGRKTPDETDASAQAQQQQQPPQQQ
mmetsp:Transcript_20494/g.51938  ORF Transcript_20494/g.51938 Transcript_20494/m.51938 type:complete len:137 (-) Transcript_20494:587-997(-)|eukprot:CAMPEP_0202862824 /NCGR_PEP_ID=MMETSP1391-20130828/3717_1 /ASSEMBLY_ACC=CAM_ASM_000867 /TAXON_ID=1034604 /ORGANISM="Chlamydomonas leiostraca, Strain SAG 11-49" /LENGTH=136 /DNA_ID=CAMNT_0049542401 /DNA_START=177 /DNA_END=587 /DNA_ORIENTATION=-